MNNKSENNSHSPFSAMILKAALYAQQGNMHAFERIMNRCSEICEKTFSENIFLKEKIKKETSKRNIQEKKYQAAEKCFKSTMDTFDHIQADLTLIQKMSSLKQLPQVLGNISKKRNLGKIFLLLDSERFSDFISEKSPACPGRELEALVENLRKKSGSRSAYIGKVANLSSIAQPGSEIKNEISTFDTGSCFIQPLEDKYFPAKTIGLIAFFDSNQMRYSPEMRTDLLKHFCRTISCNLINMLEHELLLRESTTDPLTKANNRTYLSRHAPRILSFAQRKKFSLTALFIDLDRFKSINDKYGHEAGDLVLVEVARLIKKEVRTQDIFVRMGGDEFLVILTDADLRSSRSLGSRIKSSIENIDLKNLCGADSDDSVGASIGTAEYKPGQSLEQFIQNADSRMYAAKQAGKLTT